MAVDYYRELGVGPNASSNEIRTAYRRMAMKWHPDRWMKVPSQAEEAKKKFQDVQEAYSVLSDGRRRWLYNAGLHDVAQEDDEGFSDFVQEMVSLMEKERNKKRTYGLAELRDMLFDMMAGHEPSEQYWVETSRPEARSSAKRARVGQDHGHPTSVQFPVVNSRSSRLLNVGAVW